MRQGIDQNIELDQMVDTSGNENSYWELIVNNTPLYLRWSNGQYFVM